MTQDWLYAGAATIIAIGMLAQLMFPGPHAARPATFGKKAAIIGLHAGIVGMWLLLAALDVREGEWMAALLDLALAGFFGVHGLRAYRHRRLTVLDSRERLAT